MKISIPSFRGRAPRVSPAKLGEGYATVADSPRLLSGDLEAWQQRAQVGLLPKSGGINTIYRLASRTADPTPYWLHWTDAELADGQTNVDVALGPEPADTAVATYFTGTTLGPRYTSKFLATDPSQQGGSPPGGYPYASLPLGIAPPTGRPTVVQVLPVIPENSQTHFESGASEANFQVARTGGAYANLFVQTAADGAAPADALTPPRLFLQWQAGGGALATWTASYSFALATSFELDVNLDTAAPGSGGNQAHGDGSVILLSSPDAIGARIDVRFRGGNDVRYIDAASGADPVPVPGVTVDGNTPVRLRVVGTKRASVAGDPITRWTLNIEVYDYATDALLGSLMNQTATANGDLVLIGGSNGSQSNATALFFNELRLVTTLPPAGLAVPVFTNYVYTLVNSLGWESAPSPVSVLYSVDDGSTNVVTIPAQTATDIAEIRLYRLSTSPGNADYLLVTSILPTPPALTVATPVDFADSLLSDALPGDLLITTFFSEPPANLAGLVALSNGALAGFVRNQLCFSEPSYPYAWPVRYRLPTDYNIVAIAAINSAVVVLTESFVRLAVGTLPGSYALESLAYPQGCVSKRSVAYVSTAGVLYASPDGLYSITGSGPPRNTTEFLFSRREWQALNPASIIGAAHDDRYFGFYDATAIGGGRGGFILDFREGGFGLIDIPDHATAVYADPITDVLYFVADDGLLEGASAAGLLRFTAATYSGAPGSTINAVVERVGGSDGAVSASYATADGVAIGSEFGTTGSDYFDNAGTVNFADGETSKIIPIGTVIPSYDAEVAQGSPWAYWKFNEASGTTVLDSSGNARNLTVAAGTLERSQDTLNATASVSTRIGTGDRVERVSTGLVGHIDIAVEGWFQSTSAAGTAKTLFSVGGVTADASANTNWQFRPAIEANGSPSIFWEYNVGVNENIGFPEFQTTVADFISQNIPFYFVFGRRAALNQVYCRINDLPVVTKTYANPPTGGSTTVAGVGNQQSNDLPANGRFSHVAVYLTPVEPNRYARWRLNAERNLLLSLSNATGGAAIGSPSAANVVVQA